MPGISGGRIDFSNARGYTVSELRCLREWPDYSVYSQEPELTGYKVTSLQENIWTYNAGYGIYEDVYALYEDGEGVQCMAGPYCLLYRMADLAEPVITEPSIRLSRDGYEMIPTEDFQLTWNKSADEDTEYTIYAFGAVHGSTLGLSRWQKEHVAENTVTVPFKEFGRANIRYWFRVEVFSKTTQEFCRFDSKIFMAYNPAPVTEEPVLTEPFSSVGSLSDAEFMPLIPYTGDLKFSWGSVKNAARYRIDLKVVLTNRESISLFQKETEDLSVTIEASVLEKYVDSADVDNFAVILESIDAQGGSVGGNHWKRFRFGAPDELGVVSGSVSIGWKPGSRTALPAGEHTFRWNPVEGATGYQVYLMETGKSAFIYSAQEFITDGDLSLTATLKKDTVYALVIHAKNGDKVLNGGRYWIEAGYREISAPEILSPTADFLLHQKDLPVKWTDTGAESYTVGLTRYSREDATEAYGYYGEDQSYYSIQVDEKKELKNTECTFTADQLSAGGMYRIQVTANYADDYTRKSEFFFKVSGDAAQMPSVQGVHADREIGTAGLNFGVEEISIRWNEDENAAWYDAALYSLDDNGNRMKMVQKAASEETSIALKCNLAEDVPIWELCVRKYGKDYFSTEYRFYFRLIRADETATLKLPEGMTKVEAEAFRGCGGVKYIYVPDSVTEIGEDAFADCPEAVIVCSEGSVAWEYAEKNGLMKVAE